VSLALPTYVGVEIDAQEAGDHRRIGTLRRAGAGPLVAFAYDDAWAGDPDAFSIDPALGLYGGDQFPRGGTNIAGIFADAAPDRWGRTLLERAERVRARSEGRRPRSLGEWEFLLRVSDATRVGALRFVTDDGRHLDDGPSTVPPLTRLRDLEAAARELDESGQLGADEGRSLALLLAPGSSLGGARPKANFEGEDGELWIAKFPSNADRHDVGACEYLLNELAARVGIDVPVHRLLSLGPRHGTFAAKRFDRSGRGRHLYASAMTLCGRRDGEEASYLDIALAIADHADPAGIEADLAQLYRRLAFNVLTSHRDDHLRNHGFLRGPDGWRLAPAFDLNPTPGKLGHELSIDGASREGDIELVRDAASFFRLSAGRADAIIEEVSAVVSRWRDIASTVPLGVQEVGLLEEAILADGAQKEST
jgi:serine/threonine-protein kinase HipA